MLIMYIEELGNLIVFLLKKGTIALKDVKFTRHNDKFNLNIKSFC